MLLVHQQSINEGMSYVLSKHSCTANLKGENGINTLSCSKPWIMKTKPHANKFKMVLAQCLEGHVLRLMLKFVCKMKRFKLYAPIMRLHHLSAQIEGYMSIKKDEECLKMIVLLASYNWAH